MILDFVKKYGTTYSVYLFTAIIVAVSITITYFTVYYFQHNVILYEIMLPTLVPILIFPIPAKKFFDVVLKLDNKEKKLKENNIELERSIKVVKILEGLFPICSSCKSIRDDDGEWNEIASYIEKKSDATFSHSVCPDCFAKLYPNLKNPEQA